MNLTCLDWPRLAGKFYRVGGETIPVCDVLAPTNRRTTGGCEFETNASASSGDYCFWFIKSAKGPTDRSVPVGCEGL